MFIMEQTETEIHIVYKTTNLVNSRFYIGVHKQNGIEFDGYLGTGNNIKRAVKKYGPENFLRETLYTFGIPEEAYEKEKELVNKKFVSDPKSYNLMCGGCGMAGSYSTSEESKKKMSLAAQNRSEETKEKISLAGKENKNRLGKKHSEESKKKMSLSAKNKPPISEETRQKISQNSKGRKYCYNPITLERKMIPKDSELPDGFVYGMKPRIK
jgi:group I intron endonuclease